MLKIRIQGTPNPNARKYVLDEELKAEGKVTYKDREECSHVPLASLLMSIPGVKQIHFFENVLTVTRESNYDWAKIDHAAQNVLDKNILEHDIYFNEQRDVPLTEKPDLPAHLQEIDAIIDRMIRPSLQLDGGDIELVHYEENILQIRYMGACGDCPSSMAGTLHAIQSVLQDELNPNIQIVVV